MPAGGDIAQQIFWYTAFTPDMVKPGSVVMNADGSAKWRVAPSPHGAYWRPGMKLGYQDCGAWTLPASTPTHRRQAAWLQRPGAPKPKLTDEEGRGRTMDYEEMLEAWRQGRASV